MLKAGNLGGDLFCYKSCKEVHLLVCHYISQGEGKGGRWEEGPELALFSKLQILLRYNLTFFTRRLVRFE